MAMVFELGGPPNENHLSPGIRTLLHITRVLPVQARLQGNPSHAIGRAARLFREIPVAINLQQKLDTELNQCIGLTTEEAMVPGIAFAITQSSKVRQWKPAGLKLDSFMTSQQITDWLNEFSITPADYRKAVNGGSKSVDEIADRYELDPLLYHPVIKLENPELYLIPSPIHLLESVTTGIFYRLSQIHTRRWQYRNEFGSKIMREYVREQLLRGSAKSQLRVFDCDKGFQLPKGQRKPDFLISNGRELLVIELKTAFFSTRLKHFVQAEEIRNYVRSKDRFRDPLRQIHSFVQAVRAGKTSLPKSLAQHKIAKIVVGYETFELINAVVLPRARRHMRKRYTRGVQFLGLSDMEMLLELLERGIDIVKVMVEKSYSPVLKSNNIQNHLNGVARAHSITPQFDFITDSKDRIMNYLMT
ncbi:hypothetical protein IT575_15385 [bacterium]|nr:hypothetical protein [bacterium]